MAYTDTPCGRFLAQAEQVFGPLTDCQKVDLLLDNFYQIADTNEAKQILACVEVKHGE